MTGRITNPTPDEEPGNGVHQEKTQINGKGIGSGQHLAEQIKRPSNGSENEQQSINEHTNHLPKILKITAMEIATVIIPMSGAGIQEKNTGINPRNRPRT